VTFADLSNCDTSPVHTPDAIQPFGYLIALDPQRGEITHWSANLTDMSAPASRSAPLTLADLLSKQSHETLTTWSRNEASPPSLPAMRVSLPSGKDLRAVAHRNRQGYVVIELEDIESEPPEHLLAQQEAVSAFAAQLEALHDPLDVCEAATDAIRRLTGYDRVMIYQFHPDLHGEVVSEARDERLESWLGLHYPATDIPAPARAIFAANKIRMIPDVNYIPVPITALDGQPSLDLTRVLLRSIAPIHIEYLHNMGVSASLTLSIRRMDALWGLVACHHYSGPKRPSTSLRAACAVLADYLSGALALKAEQQTFHFRRRKAETEQTLTAQLTSAECVPSSLCDGETNVMDLMSPECCGAAVIRGSTIKCLGQTPTTAQLQDLMRWLRSASSGDLYVTDSLSGQFPSAESFAAMASGVLAACPRAAPETAVLWFKPEFMRTVRWGGNPEKAADISGMRVHPRKSFEAWTQTVRHRSKPWAEWEIEVASSFLASLTSDELRRRMESESRARAEAERADRTKEELLGIISHDLRDPLSSVNLSLLLMKKLMSPESRTATAPTVGSMERAVAQMTGLVQNLLEVSAIEAGSLKLSLQPMPAAQLLYDCVDVLNPLANEKNILLALKVAPEPVMIKADRDQLLQVCSNLIGNAIKFTPSGGEVEVCLRETTKRAIIEVNDTGPGVPPEDLPNIFDRFYRARTAKTRGVGLGLAIAKGIVEAHGGAINVRSEPGKGACFWFTVPKA
jgi:light-regulated signal transduction histidine kinase (bacteriophytochrome)